jgi:hypothetical protein
MMASQPAPQQKLNSLPYALPLLSQGGSRYGYLSAFTSGNLSTTVLQHGILEVGDMVRAEPHMVHTALRGLCKNIAQVYSGNNDPPRTTILASADVLTTPTITWPTPDLIPYGNKLTFAQLNATASVEGTLV